MVCPPPSIIMVCLPHRVPVRLPRRVPVRSTHHKSVLRVKNAYKAFNPFNAFNAFNALKAFLLKVQGCLGFEEEEGAAAEAAGPAAAGLLRLRARAPVQAATRQLALEQEVHLPQRWRGRTGGRRRHRRS
jgi:hypothetical protein